LVAFVSEVEKEGTPYHGPAIQDVTKEEVMSFFDKWEEEVRVLIRVSNVPQKSTRLLA
jgi:salicylate hydroxylase